MTRSNSTPRNELWSLRADLQLKLEVVEEILTNLTDLNDENFTLDQKLMISKAIVNASGLRTRFQTALRDIDTLLDTNFKKES